MLSLGPSHFAFLHLPFFTIVAGSVLLAGLVSFIVGLCRWKRTGGKLLVVFGGLVFLLFLAAAACVLLTVWSGSMG